MPLNNIDFSINGSLLFVQPSGIHEIYPAVSEVVTLSGKRVIIEPSAPPVVEVVFGVDAQKTSAVTELRNRRPSGGSIQISYIPPGGTVVTRNAYMPFIPYQQFVSTQFVAQLTFQFYTLS